MPWNTGNNLPPPLSTPFILFYSKGKDFDYPPNSPRILLVIPRRSLEFYKSVSDKTVKKEKKNKYYSAGTKKFVSPSSSPPSLDHRNRGHETWTIPIHRMPPRNPPIPFLPPSPPSFHDRPRGNLRATLSIEISTAGFWKRSVRSSHHRDPPTYMPLTPIRVYMRTYTHIYERYTSHQHLFTRHIGVASVQRSNEWGRMVGRSVVGGGGGGGGVIASAQIEYISYVFITTAPGPRPSLSAPPPATPPAGVASTTSGTARGMERPLVRATRREEARLGRLARKKNER